VLDDPSPTAAAANAVCATCNQAKSPSEYSKNQVIHMAIDALAVAHARAEAARYYTHSPRAQDKASPIAIGLSDSPIAARLFMQFGLQSGYLTA
jgi:hypothetical protein